MELKFYNKHYITINSSNHIISGWSSGPHPEIDISDAICINEEAGYQFRLYPDGAENPNLFDNEGFPLYKYEDGEILLLSNVEKTIIKAKAENKKLPTIKLQLITDSKNKLNQFLVNHPLVWTDKKEYSVTQEKQALLTQQLALYSLDPETKLYWNASGEECKVWPIVALASLAKSIADYVRPYVRYQQQKESEIDSAETAEEARNIIIDYDTLS